MLRRWTRAVKQRGLPPQGEEGIEKVGAREYVGGLWDEMGDLQISFLRSQGMLPSHVLLDVGCGALRGGVAFIAYLDAGNYLGLDKEASLIRHGLENELTPDVVAEKRPELVVSDRFEFERLSKKPDFAIAQSLLTHLTPGLINDCMSKLGMFVEPGCRFFATFFEGSSSGNPREPHDSLPFAYSRDEMSAFGTANGWRFNYIGDWKHPRGQVMAEYVAT